MEENNNNSKEDFFSIGEMTEFEQDFGSDPGNADPESFEDYDDYEVINGDAQPNENTGDAEIFKLLLGLFDDTRALGCSMYSGLPKERYTFYQVDSMKNSHPIIKAGARLVAKWNLQNSGEYILLIALVGSTIYVGNMARKDKRSQEAEIEIINETETTTDEKEKKEKE